MMENKEHQPIDEFIKEYFIIYREHNKYSPVYFYPKSKSIYNGVLAVGDFDPTKGAHDYKWDIKPMSFEDFGRVPKVELVKDNTVEPEFIRALYYDFLTNKEREAK